MSYWDINQFLAEQERVEFCLHHDAFQMDFLDPSKQGIIPAGQTLNAPIWMVNTLFDYLQLGQTQADMMKVSIPEDFHSKSLDRINSFRSSHRSTVQQVRTKAQLPYFYEMYEAIKKITQHEGSKLKGQIMGDLLEERGKLIITRASSAFEQEKADAVTNNYTKFEMDLYKQAKKMTINYEKWKTA